MERVEAKAHLQHQRHEERLRPVRNPENRAAHDREAEDRIAEKLQCQDRVRHATGVADVKHERNHTKRGGANADYGRQRRKADDREAKDYSGGGNAAEEEARPVQPGRFARGHLRQVD